MMSEQLEIRKRMTVLTKVPINVLKPTFIGNFLMKLDVEHLGLKIPWMFVLKMTKCNYRMKY
jgi:hypothetical protein